MATTTTSTAAPTYSNYYDTAAVSSVLGEANLLSSIFHYAISNTKEVPSISLACRHWDDVLNKNPKTGRSLWRSICTAQDPEIIRIFDLCKESKGCPDIPGGGWKILLYRSFSSCFTPSGVNKRLQRSLELVFKEEGITAFSNCCGNCTDSYESCSAFKSREKGITFFKFFLNGMNYEGGDAHKAFVSYSDLNYLHEHWEDECDIIRRWCAVLGVTDYSVDKPESQVTCIIVNFKEPVTLEDYEWESDDSSAASSEAWE